MYQKLFLDMVIADVGKTLKKGALARPIHGLTKKHYQGTGPQTEICTPNKYEQWSLPLITMMFFD